MNTYAEVAAKLKKSVSFVRKLVATRQIAVVDLGHRTKLITDEALAKYLENLTVRSI